MGLAAAMRTGIRAVTACASPEDIIVTMDSDNTHPIDVLPKMIEMTEVDYDVIVASRFRVDSAVVGVPWFRQMTSYAAGILFKVLFSHSGNPRLHLRVSGLSCWTHCKGPSTITVKS